MFKRLDKIRNRPAFGVAERTDDSRQCIVQVGCRNTGEYEEIRTEKWQTWFSHTGRRLNK